MIRVPMENPMDFGPRFRKTDTGTRSDQTNPHNYAIDPYTYTPLYNTHKDEATIHSYPLVGSCS